MVRIYGDFRDFGRFWAAKNKAKQSQTKPISVSPQTCSGGLKTNLKKQSQFADGQNWRKLLLERMLW